VHAPKPNFLIGNTPRGDAAPKAGILTFGAAPKVK